MAEKKKFVKPEIKEIQLKTKRCILEASCPTHSPSDPSGSSTSSRSVRFDDYE